ncbi:hypothetical protein [Palleronia caenipelagi]|uniref:Uncharacterized protein n=1 Tax=Palleronia caenipelagi TaxID=2489174 RepID=A0A547Q5L6_9RHOB|nr:hypothetical protein [Palleronia caenipelagi]TRD21659.1 hypothetical protein FEV53_07920 [Palleronia caenipelagi]
MDEIGSGKVICFGKAKPGQLFTGTARPAPDDAHIPTVSADFLRYVILGGCPALTARGVTVPAKGVQVAGLWITGVLDMQTEQITRDIALLDCYIERPPVFYSASLRSLFLSGSELPGFEGDRMTASGGVFFRDMKISREICLPGARIAGNFELTDCAFEAGRGDGIDLTKADIAGIFFFQGVKQLTGAVRMGAARISSLVDDHDSWPSGKVYLNGLTYDAFGGDAATDGTARIAWLDRQRHDDVNEDFRPQPWEQCAKVLREMGHGEAARAVLIAKEERQRRAQRMRLKKAGQPAFATIRAVWDHILWATTAYGHQPFRALWSMVVLFVFGAMVFHHAAQIGSMAPTSPEMVMLDAKWIGCESGPAYEALDCFKRNAPDFPRFNSYVFSLDTLLPVVSFGMEGYWLPSEARGTRFATFAAGYLWFHIAAGWVLSLLLVAGLSGLIRTDNTK